MSVGKKVKTLAKIFSYRLKLYENSVNADFNNIKILIKKYIYKGNVQHSKLEDFYNYIKKQNKKLNCSKPNDIFKKNFFKEPS